MLRDISKKYFAREFALSEEDVADLIEEAVVALNQNMAEFDRCLGQKAEEQRLKDIAHSLKGNLLNMGLDEQAEKALVLEDMIGTDDEQAKDLYMTLKQELDGF